MMVKLSKTEKEGMCAQLAEHLPRIRKLLSVTQAEFGELCGLARTTISQIENKKVPVTWLYLNAILLICVSNYRTKEYFYANNLLGPRFLQYIQQKDENIPPDTNIIVHEQLIGAYQEYQALKQGKSKQL